MTEESSLRLTPQQSKTQTSPQAPPLAASAISSVVAQRALKVLEQQIRARNFGAELRPGQGINPLYHLSGELQLYRDWLREQLKRSDLAQRLPAGIEAFPDISAALPQWIGPLERVFRPRSVEQTTMHLLRNLEWYLAPQRETKRPRNMVWLLLLGVGVLVLFIVVWLIRWIATGRFDFPFQFLSLWYLWAGLFGVVGLIGKGGFLSGENPQSQKFLVNAMELYRHLCETYSDVPTEDDEPEASIASDELELASSARSSRLQEPQR